MEKLTFKELGLSSEVLRAVEDMGFEEPSKIQAEAIPTVLQGKDMIGQAQTGTGKTFAFGAPLLSMIEFDKDAEKDKYIKCLILTPTRELAIQVNDELLRIGKYVRARILPVYGGQPIDRQIKALKRRTDVVVGTPGRVLDLVRRNVINLSNLQFLVLDEADEMLNMGFVEDIEAILEKANEDRQTLLFSATMPPQIKAISKNYMKPDSIHVSIIKSVKTVDSVDQFYFEVKNKDRFETLCRLLDVDEPKSAIIFCRTKKGVDELVEAMQGRGYNVEGMHGDMNQNHRINTLKKFKEGSLEFLVATDVAARGIDVESITHVINYDLPQDNESYIHRIGRTGRANRTGVAYTLVTAREYSTLKQIEKTTKGKIKRKDIPSVDEIFKVKYNNIIERVKSTLEKEDYKKFNNLATELDEDYNLIDVAAALMNILYEKELSFDYEKNVLETESSSSRLFVNQGKIDKLNPKDIVAFLIEKGNVSKEHIGNIDILDKFSFVDIKLDIAEDVIKNCSGKKINGKKVRLEISEKKRSSKPRSTSNSAPRRQGNFSSERKRRKKAQ